MFQSHRPFQGRNLIVVSTNLDIAMVPTFRGMFITTLLPNGRGFLGRNTSTFSFDSESYRKLNYKMIEKIIWSDSTTKVFIVFSPS